jgi:hypothetical protein
VTVDLNSDGVDDLVVSAPQFNSTAVDYRGVVWIFFGVKGGKKFPSVPSAEIYVPWAAAGILFI